MLEEGGRESLGEEGPPELLLLLLMIWMKHGRPYSKRIMFAFMGWEKEK